MLKDHKGLHFTPFPNKTNHKIFLEHPKTLSWTIFGHFYHTCPLASYKISEKNEPIPRKALDWWMDEHTLLHTDPSRHDQGVKKQKLNSNKPWTPQSSRHWHYLINPLSANRTKWSNTLKQFLSKNWRIVWLCLTIL